jgi:autotransporter-associated beta strand protein
MLTLSGNDFYNGGTTISGGTLQLGLGSALALGSGGLTANAGILDLMGKAWRKKTLAYPHLSTGLSAGIRVALGE